MISLPQFFHLTSAMFQKSSVANICSG